MYYFDNKFLKQYIDQKQQLKVFSDSEWYFVADTDDLADPVSCVAYDVYGQRHITDYRSIEKIKIGSRVITTDMLQQMMAGTSAEEEPTKKDSPKGEEEEPEEEPAEKEPELAHYDPYSIGREIIREFRKENRRGNKH